jgi:hypothetical protein
MSLYSITTKAPEYYIICLINSNFISYYVNDFINNTQTFQINDARQLPIIIPTEHQLTQFESIFNSAYKIKQAEYLNQLSIEKVESELGQLQNKVDNFVNKLYNLI